MNIHSTRTRRNFMIRTIAGLTGDLAIGIALANACLWLIQAASLGLFLSFLVWLIGLVLSLALSQYAVHPAVKFALCDRKLDQGIAAATRFAQSTFRFAAEADPSVWQQLRRRFAL